MYSVALKTEMEKEYLHYGQYWPAYLRIRNKCTNSLMITQRLYAVGLLWNWQPFGGNDIIAVCQ